ncbi:HAD-IA family hydrolase [Flavivirga amylovorans]|uniref:HAD-IA family hydrolase n=1 Tax=Flavivirga amylovorans TaxID=870486 RepID=A0ABT8WXH6_9FLAO|nr:HAD-IA family hydrolase [Flavivirga amylovorans]MDO5986388.1 HAD-IA family hydrolase [Flavivirga amylovorans]
MSTIKYILFDAANTLIHKPSLWLNYIQALKDFGYNVSEKELKKRHKLLSEYIKFPDITSQDFYNTFNKELINAFGIIDTPELLNNIFNTCKYLPWEAFNDVKYISNFSSCKYGVLSNFNSGLRSILKEKIEDINFEHVIISEEEKVAKPNIEFYKIALKKIGLKASEILFIGDSLKLDIKPALEVGFKVHLIDRDCIYTSSKYRIESFKDIRI